MHSPGTTTKKHLEFYSNACTGAEDEEAAFLGSSARAVYRTLEVFDLSSDILVGFVMDWCDAKLFPRFERSSDSGIGTW